MTEEKLCFNDALVDAIAGMDLPGSWVDRGIGHYDYCGAPGYDSREVFEASDQVEITVEWSEYEERRDEGPALERRMNKTFVFGEDDEQSVVVEVPVVLEKATVTRQLDGTYNWTAVYLVGD